MKLLVVLSSEWLRHLAQGGGGLMELVEHFKDAIFAQTR
jgi:hypothetical protein